MKCRRCDFEGTQDEVDDHFVSRIETGDLDHVRMARLGQTLIYRTTSVVRGACWANACTPTPS
jgi:hypothetical protein